MLTSLTMQTEETTSKRIKSNYYVEGYATTWLPYKLYDDKSGPIFEQFTKEAFSECDMSDIIMQYDHAGKVLARLSNGTLIVEPNDRGLFICADLGRSTSAKELYEEISNGLITKMSWGFLPGDFHFNKDSRTIIHTKVKKIFDVSAVSIPANDTTNISVRSFTDGAISKVMQEMQERKIKVLNLIFKLEGITNGNDKT